MSAETMVAAPVTPVAASRSTVWRRYGRNPLVVAATIFVAVGSVVAVIAPSFLDPFAFSDVTYGPPSLDHLMGTDHLGRDIFAQVVFSLRSALLVGVGAALIAALVGTVIGAIAGYFGSWSDGVLMRVTDIMLSVPTFFVLLLFGILFGGGLPLITLVMGLTLWTGTARVVRAEVLAQNQRGYVEAARATGAGNAHLLLREILPNSIHPAIALISLTAAWAILAEAGLSFLGLRDPREVTYGWMLNVALDHYTSAWWMALFPGLALSLLVFAFNLIGDGVNDARNPRVREGRSSKPVRPVAHEAVTPTTVGAATASRAVETAAGRPLTISNLSVDFPVGRQTARVVDTISLTVAEGEIVGLVGESGSGKSMTALSVVGLIPAPGYAATGSIRAAGREVVGAKPKEIADIRRHVVAIAFQDPQSALNPLITVGDQIAESLMAAGTPKAKAYPAAIEAMDSMRIPAAAKRARAYPYQLSGGMRQRVLLAIALVREPRLLILDEPTTALDVITQNQILGLIREQVRARRLGVLLITHDLSVVAQTCDRVFVMYAGRIVETSDTQALLAGPRHPYSQGLIDSIPELAAGRGARLAAIPGTVPLPLQLPSGCRFHPRCPARMDVCLEKDPPMFGIEDGHPAACWLLEDGRRTQEDVWASAAVHST